MTSVGITNVADDVLMFNLPWSRSPTGARLRKGNQTKNQKRMERRQAVQQLLHKQDRRHAVETTSLQHVRPPRNAKDPKRGRSQNQRNKELQSPNAGWNDEWQERHEGHRCDRNSNEAKVVLRVEDRQLNRGEMVKIHPRPPVTRPIGRPRSRWKDDFKKILLDCNKNYIKHLISLLKAKGGKIALIVVKNRGMREDCAVLQVWYVCYMFDASSHSRCLENIHMASKKDVIQGFLKQYDITYQQRATKSILMSMVKKVVGGREDQFRRRTVDTLCATNGIKLLRLPPYHANFNSIEFCVGLDKTKFEISQTEQTTSPESRNTLQFMETMPLARIQSFFDHVVNEENELETYDNCNIDFNPLIDDDNHE
uniref:Helitron_like_N domain-containing protein n=1 Tax=Steinernema glaseri TaxID=37863 RepID=A0A1I8AIW6_9BILA